MPEKVLAAVKVGPSTTELHELDLPPVPDDASLMRVEVAGVCGTDPFRIMKFFLRDVTTAGARDRFGVFRRTALHGSTVPSTPGGTQRFPSGAGVFAQNNKSAESKRLRARNGGDSRPVLLPEHHPAAHAMDSTDLLLHEHRAAQAPLGSRV